MSTRYEIQEFCLFGGWVNNWSYDDDQGHEVKSTFSTLEEAQAELEWFFKECEEEVKAGNLEDVPSREDFRIKEIHA